MRKVIPFAVMLAVAGVADAKEVRYTLVYVQSTSQDEYLGVVERSTAAYVVTTKACEWDVDSVSARLAYDPDVEEGKVRGWITFFRYNRKTGENETVGTCNVLRLKVIE